MLTAIVGINWGDEGKGRMVDLLSEDYDIIVRYQGGNNAGHTVINDKGKFILNLLPSGIIRQDKINVMGCGMVIDVEHLFKEVKKLKDSGIEITPNNLKISDKATICMPYHKLLDCLEEDRLSDKKFGSTRRGIAPSYSDKYMKKSFRMEDLLHPEILEEKIEDILEWKNLTVVNGYGHAAITKKEILDWLMEYGMPFRDYICNTTDYLSVTSIGEKRIMFEAQLGALRDIDYGIFPYTSSSSTIAAYAPIGAGIPMRKIDSTIGIMKAYSSCVGEGPFVCELFGKEGDALREAGGEYGAATGRPRRVGGFDVVASKYGVKVQGATELALTKLDVLSAFDKIPVCVAYKIKDKITTDFPIGEDLRIAEPVIEYFDGWKTDISQCRTVRDLPRAAMEYVGYLASSVNCHITYISVGAGRDEYIKCETEF